MIALPLWVFLAEQTKNLLVQSAKKQIGKNRKHNFF